MRWVLDQADLRIRLRGGAGGVGSEISLVLTTELADPAKWLSGGELVLTTGIGLPAGSDDRRRYLQLLHESGVAGVGFGVGLTFDARLVWSRQPKYDGKPSTIVVGRKSPGEVEGALIPVGREIIEAYPPRGTAGILQMLSFAGAPPPGTTHLYLFFAFEPQGWR